VPVQFIGAADKHCVPRAESLYVALTGTSHRITTSQGRPGTLIVGRDRRGVELEVITVQRHGRETIIHAMPTANRHRHQTKEPT
jgi:hypothetical protein